MKTPLRLHHVAVVILCLYVAACGTDPVDEEASGQTAAARDEPPMDVSAALQGEASFALTAEDVAAYERGVRRQIEMLRSAGQRLALARDDDETLDILAEIQPLPLRAEGARAAGVAEGRYVSLSEAINAVLGKVEMTAAVRQMAPSPEEIAAVPDELRAQLEENLREINAALAEPYAGLAPDAAEALRSRAESLSQLRAELIGALAGITR